MRWLIHVILALALVAGCGRQEASPRAAAPSGGSPAAAAGLVTYPRFEDAKPHRWTGRAPDSYPIHGIDVSRYQGAIDWARARDAGVSFAFLKATEGGDRADPLFEAHWQGATRAGIPTGAYHFFYFCTPAEVQARWFIKNVRKHPGMLPPVVDLEWNPFSPTCTHRPEGSVVRREARIFIAALEAHYGQRPIVYTTPAFYADTGIGQLRAVEFWLRSTAKPLPEAYPGQPWRFWQYSGTGLVPGFLNEVDLNLFNGTAADWTAWLQKRRV